MFKEMLQGTYSILKSFFLRILKALKGNDLVLGLYNV